MFINPNLGLPRVTGLDFVFAALLVAFFIALDRWPQVAARAPGVKRVATAVGWVVLNLALLMGALARDAMEWAALRWDEHVIGGEPWRRKR